MIRPPPRSTPFPYTTLSRSLGVEARDGSYPGLARDGGLPRLLGADRQRRDEPDPGDHHSAFDALHDEWVLRSEEHMSELQSQSNLVCRLLLEKKKSHTPPHF